MGVLEPSGICGIFCPEIIRVELGSGPPAVYFCTLGPDHDSDHEAHGSNGRVVKAWPKS